MSTYRHIAILGLGLMGSSAARAVRAHFPGMRITAMDADAAALRTAEELGLADRYTRDATEAVRGADLVLLAVPVAALKEVVLAMAPGLEKGVTVTDVSSVKQLLLNDIKPLLPAGAALVPAHPIAGSEKTGAAAGSAALFAGKRVILTPETPQDQGVEQIAAFWRSLQAEVQFMPAALHDEIYACVSHLPQYIAFVISDLYAMFHVKHINDEPLQRFLRLQSSNRVLWNGVFGANKMYLDKWIKVFLQVLHQIKSELQQYGNFTTEPTAPEVVFSHLFPRVVASCMAHTAHVAERELRLPLKAYAGTGFADFTAPAHTPPEEHLELISRHAPAVSNLLEELGKRLQRGR